MTLIDIFLDLICPTLGALLATIMFGAPILDLRRAMKRGALGDLNPFPWVMTTGNCLGWCIYSFLQGRDPFLMAANLPGLVVSFWLNSGAAKLQYQEMMDLKRTQSIAAREEWDASAPVETEEDEPSERSIGRNEFNTEQMVTVPQERSLMRMLSFWSLVVIYIGWVDTKNAAFVVGLTVNLNLIFFYGAPLQTIFKVIKEGHSNSIHRPTLYMNWTNTSFWILYGLAKMDPWIILPNVTGLSLGLVQGVLCNFYPQTSFNQSHEPVSLNDDEDASGLVE